jgi:hypothetical protein
MTVWALHLQLSSGTTPPEPAVRRYRPGHYLAIGNNNSQRDSYTDELTWPGNQGVQFRYRWVDIEPTQDNYTAKPILDDLEIISNVTTARGKKDAQLIAMLEDKSFLPNPTPLPVYMQPYSSPNARGTTVWRWDPYVVERWAKLIKFLGPFVDNHPNFAGFAVQETSMSFGASPGHGYTDLKYRDSIISALLSMTSATPHAVAYWYHNYMPAPATDFRLDEIITACKGKGVIMGGPDILPESDELEKRVYPRYRTKGYGQLPMFCSCQHDSYDHVHQSNYAADNFGLTGYTWSNGDYWTMEQLYAWATTTNARSIHVQTVIWEVRATGPNDVTDSKAVMAKFPNWTVAGADNTP